MCEGTAYRSTPLNSIGRSNILSQLKQPISLLYKYSTSMLRLNSNNQNCITVFFYNNKKQTTIVNSSCHFKPNVNHLRLTSTYTSYFLSLSFVAKYYKSAVSVGGDSVKSDQTYIWTERKEKKERKKERKKEGNKRTDGYFNDVNFSKIWRRTNVAGELTSQAN
jgi:hypothetical protein